MDLEEINMELSINNVSVEIDNHQILDDVSLHVNNLQTVGIVGPNGCGKSTLLKTVYKMIKPNKGEIFLDGIDIIAEKEKKVAQNIAVVSQFNELSFDFSIYDIVIMGRSPYKKMLENDNTNDHNLTVNALKKVGLYDIKDRSYLTLSGGEKQRAILARAMVQTPKMLLLDEPTNHLDIKYQLQLMRIVKSLNIEVIAAIHDLNIAAMYCDKIYVLKDGKIVQYGTPKEILTPQLIKNVYEVDAELIVDKDRVHISYLI